MPTKKKKGQGQKKGLTMSWSMGAQMFDDMMRRIQQKQDQKYAKTQEEIASMRHHVNQQSRKNREFQSKTENFIKHQTNKLMSMLRKENKIAGMDATLKEKEKQLAKSKEEYELIHRELNTKMEGHQSLVMSIMRKQAEGAKWIELNSSKAEDPNQSFANVEQEFDGDEKKEENVISGYGDVVEEQLEALSRKSVNLDQLLKDKKVIVCIGKTGLGKSTFANRFCCDFSEEGNELQNGFKVGEDYESTTQKISHKVQTHNGGEYCIVDTPGTLDSNNKDDEHKRNIAKYLRGSGGVNAFLVFFNMGESVVDGTYIELLKYYSTLLETDDSDATWWDHVIIIGTHFECFESKYGKKLGGMDEQKKKEFVDAKLQLIRDKFKKNESLKIPESSLLPIFTTSHESYASAVEDLIRAVPTSKFEISHEAGVGISVTELEKEAWKSIGAIRLIEQNLLKKKRDLDEMEAEINGVKQQLQSLRGP